MKRLVFAGLLAVPLLSLTSPLAAAAASPQSTNAQRALQWLQCMQQQPDGQIGSGGNPIARSAEVALGLAAAGQPASAMRRGSVSLADYLKTAVSTDVGTNGELLLARALDPSAGTTATLITQLATAKSMTGATAGEYGGDIFSDALAILGLHAAKQPIGSDSMRFLRSKQDPDKGWSFDNAQSGSDSNTTALVVQALLAAGVSPADTAITGAFGYLKTQFQNGGFVFSTQYGTVPDAQSDEAAIEAIVAADLDTNESWSSYLRAALANLAGLQNADGALAGFDKVMATTPAALAFLLQPLTATAPRATGVPLLACPTAAATSAPTAAPSVRSTPRAVPLLAQTGDPHSSNADLVLLALGFFLAAVTVWRRRTT